VARQTGSEMHALRVIHLLSRQPNGGGGGVLFMSNVVNNLKVSLLCLIEFGFTEIGK